MVGRASCVCVKADVKDRREVRRHVLSVLGGSFASMGWIIWEGCDWGFFRTSILSVVLLIGLFFLIPW